MTLLNGLLAFGAAAFTIPLFIHLLHRSRYQTIDWSAMHLLPTSRNLNSRRMQWRQIILLLLRCALPVLLAMAMARPLFHSFLSADGRSAMSIAIVIDDSKSMFATDPLEVGNTNPTRFSVACRSAAEVLKELPEGSNGFVLFGGSTPEALDGQVPDELAARLETIGLRSIPSSELSLEESIRLSVQWLAKSSHPKRQLVLISDFQNHEWSDWTGEKTSDLAKLFEVQTLRPQLSFVSVGPKSETKVFTLPNLSVDSIEVSPSLLSVAKESSIQFTLGNYGTTKCDSVLVAVFVNDIEIDRQEVSIANSSKTTLRALWFPKQSGEHEIRVQILRNDNLMADNRLSTAVVVQKPIPIMLVEGDLRVDAMRSETDFLRLALSPFSIATGEKGDAFQTKTIQPHDLSESILAGYRAVFLCNVSEVTDMQQKLLHDFVKQGNGLMVFLGDKVRTEQYQSWATLANNGLRIASYATRTDIKSNSDGERAMKVGDRVKMQQIEFDAIRELSPVSLASLASVRFENRTPIAIDPEALSNPSDASIAMCFDDDQAWILESRIGKGRCLWMSCSCDDDESNLPTRSIYVPLIQKLAAFVCNANPPATRLVAGDVWTRKMHRSSSASHDDMQTVRVTTPEGMEVSVPLADDGVLRFRKTRLLGAYYASFDEDRANPIIVCAMSKDSRFAEESTLTYLTQDELAKLAASSRATVSINSRELLSRSQSDWRGREVWTWIWAALVLCFFAEMALEQSLSPRLNSRSTSRFGKAVQGTNA